MKYLFKVIDKDSLALKFNYELKNMGDWRSRWQRQKEIWEKKGNIYVKKIYTRRTDKDFIVTKVTGVNKDGDYFIAVPDLTDRTPVDRTKGTKWVKVKDDKICENCNNFIKKLGWKFNKRTD